MRDPLEEYLNCQLLGRLSENTLQSTIRNLKATWTQSGHLRGRIHKIRSQASPTAGSVALALLLGYIRGARGEALFQTEYADLLDCSFEAAVALASEASRKGWIVLNRIGNVIEAGFPNLLTDAEREG